MTARFLFNSQLWDELEERVPRARKVRAAVAYLGSGGSKLLPLRKGDELVVDMSLRTVRAGATDPREVRKLLQRGVHVYSRGSLHAKFIVLDRTVIAGSSNISNHARHVLDEAAILSDDGSVVARAAETFRSLCTEPVRPEYLKACIAAYRPPTFVFGSSASRAKPRQSLKRPTKLWLVAGLGYWDIPEREVDLVEAATSRAAKRLRDAAGSEVMKTHVGSLSKTLRAMQEGDWVVLCIEDGKGFDVHAPARFLGHERYRPPGSKPGYLLLTEVARTAQTARWQKVQALAARDVRALRLPRPRTTGIDRDAEADALLRLWDAAGRFKARRR
jgi:hypothetical protein